MKNDYRAIKRRIKKGEKFSYKCAKNQQEIEFGQADTDPRSIKKLAEIIL